MDRPTWIMGSVALALVVGVGSFLGGMQYQKSTGGNAPTISANASAPAGDGASGFGSGGNGFGGSGQFGGGQRPDIGTVAAVNGQTLTLQTFRGSDQTVDVTSSTKITDGQSGNMDQLSDVKTGDRILVSGTTGSDGTVTAQTIQVNPTFGGRFGGQGGNGSANGSSGSLGSGSSTSL